MSDADAPCRALCASELASSLASSARGSRQISSSSRAPYGDDDDDDERPAAGACIVCVCMAKFVEAEQDDSSNKKRTKSTSSPLSSLALSVYQAVVALDVRERSLTFDGFTQERTAPRRNTGGLVSYQCYCSADGGGGDSGGRVAAWRRSITWKHTLGRHTRHRIRDNHQ